MARLTVIQLLKAVWARWKVVAQKIGDVQARVMLSLFYFVVLGPFALGVKAFSDPLRLHRGAGLGWIERTSDEAEPQLQGRRQF